MTIEDWYSSSRDPKLWFDLELRTNTWRLTDLMRRHQRNECINFRQEISNLLDGMLESVESLRLISAANETNIQSYITSKTLFVKQLQRDIRVLNSSSAIFLNQLGNNYERNKYKVNVQIKLRDMTIGVRDIKLDIAKKIEALKDLRQRHKKTQDNFCDRIQKLKSLISTFPGTAN